MAFFLKCLFFMLNMVIIPWLVKWLLSNNILSETPDSARIHSGAVRGWPSVALAKHFYEGTRLL